MDSRSMQGAGMVQVGIPTYDDRVHKSLTTALQKASAGRFQKTTTILTCSVLTRAFNLLYARALNERRNDTTHFCLVHADVVPEPLWLDKMMSLMDTTGADVLAAVIPIKDEKGLTSTALDVPVGESNPRWRAKRLTLTEIYEQYPPTFTHEKLLLNTGLMLIDFRKPWVEKVWFAFEDAIIPDPKSAGNFMAVGLSEDWVFSRRARALGAKLYATREISVVHAGRKDYSNNCAWGSLAADAENA